MKKNCPICGIPSVFKEITRQNNEVAFQYQCALHGTYSVSTEVHDKLSTLDEGWVALFSNDVLSANNRLAETPQEPDQVPHFDLIPYGG